MGNIISYRISSEFYLSGILGIYRFQAENMIKRLGAGSFLQHDWLFVWKPIFLSNSGINCATKILENDDLFPIEFAATSVSVSQVDISRGVVENLLIKIILWKQTHHNVD